MEHYLLEIVWAGGSPKQYIASSLKAAQLQAAAHIIEVSEPEVDAIPRTAEELTWSHEEALEDQFGKAPEEWHCTWEDLTLKITAFPTITEETAQQAFERLVREQSNP